MSRKGETPEPSAASGAPETRLMRYHFGALIGDYLRSASGFGLCVIPLVMFSPLPWVMLLLVAGAWLFLMLGLRTALRQASRVRCDGEGVALISRFRVTELAWPEVGNVALRHYAGRRQGGEGITELTLKGQSGGWKVKIVATSRLTGFDHLLAAVARVIGQRELGVDPVTAYNFAALGHPVAGVSDAEHTG